MRFEQIISFFLFLFLFQSIFAQQQTIVTGTITEKGKNEPMPFVSVGFKGTTIGVTTDFEGDFTLKTTLTVDSIIISFVGYKTITRKINLNQTQILKIELEEASQ